MIAWADARQWAEQVLGERIDVLEPLTPEGRRTRVARCRHGTATSILKLGNDRREQDALAALAGEDVAPRLLGGDPERCLVLMEDLAGESLEEKLLRAGDPDAEAALIGFAAALGRMHAATARSGPSPELDVARICAAWGIETRETLPLRTGALIQRDVGPDNAIVTSDGVRLIDFEIAEGGDPLTDLATCHLGFPNCGAGAGAIPSDVLARMDAAYGPIDADAWGAACTFRILERLDRYHGWNVLEEDAPWGRATGRQRVLAMLAACPEHAPLARGLAALRVRLREAWPDVPAALPVFPALQGPPRSA